MITSKIFFNSSRNFIIFELVNSSDGFGGIFPAGIKYRFSTSVDFTHSLIEIFLCLPFSSIDDK